MTKEECINIALKCQTKSEFHNKYRRYYDFAKINGFFDEVVKHMKKCYKVSKITKKEVLKEALKYQNRVDFKHANPSYYNWVVNHKLQNEIFKHMEIVGNRYNRCVYVYEFIDNFCYVGLTYNLNERNIAHKNDITSEVYKHSINTNIPIPNPKQLTSYIGKDEASKLETFYYNEYKNNGWKMLNVAKTGGLGGTKKDSLYTKEYCKNIALNYKTRRDFELNHKYLYNKVRTHKWDDFVYSHMNLEDSKKIKGEKIRKSKIGKKMNITDKNNFRKTHSSKAIILFDDDNNIIEEFFSATICAEKIGGTANGIRNACKNKKKYKNLNLKYKEEYTTQKYVYTKQNSGNSKKVAQYTLDNVYVAEYNSIKDATLLFNGKISSWKISRCCNGKTSQCCGYIWKFI